MKKVCSIIILFFTTTTCFAQSKVDTSNHLSFKGVPIDGTLSEFVLKMKKTGFEHMQTKDGIAFLQGDFASYKLCTIGVSTLKTRDLVSKIEVMFQAQDTWSTLFGNYDNLKNLLTEKYGKPSAVVEKFQSSYELEDDKSKMHAVKFDRCKYITNFETEKGTIELSIVHDRVTNCFVKLTYFDKINSETIKKQALDDL